MDGEGRFHTPAGGQLSPDMTRVFEFGALSALGLFPVSSREEMRAVAQFGRGKGDGQLGNDDFGRERVTGDSRDRYRFRTTPLRNVTLTGPFGHDGAFASVRGFIDHYSESHVKLRNFDPLSLEPLLRATLLPTRRADPGYPRHDSRRRGITPRGG